VEGFFKEAQDISDKFDAVAVQLHAGRELTKDTLEKAEAAVKSLRSFKNDLIV